MIDMIADYWDWILVILVVSTISSFSSSRIGKFVSIFVTLSSITLTILLAAGGVPGSEDFILLGFVLLPALSWAGFYLGRLLQNKFHSKVSK